MADGSITRRGVIAGTAGGLALAAPVAPGADISPAEAHHVSPIQLRCPYA
jgi:hypothetical protein